MTPHPSSPGALPVFLIEDSRSDAQLIREALGKDPRVSLAGTVSNTRKAEAFLRDHPVAVILFDLILQRVERSREITRLKTLAPDAKVLVLTAYEEVERIFRALCAGADGYLLKSDRTRPLPTAILETLEFGAAFSPAVAHAIARHFHTIGKANRDAGFDGLTSQQQTVLHLLSQGFTNKEIAQKLHIAPTTVRNHIEAICETLHVRNRTHAVARFRLGPSWLSKK